MSSTMKLTSMAAVLAASIALPGTASAADLLEPPVIEVPEVVTVKKGWYIRGDISYDSEDIDSPYAFTNVPTPFRSAEIDDSYNIGVGIGYQVKDYFRVDATLEYVFGTDFHGTFDCGVCAGGLTQETAEISKLRLLANAYVDLGTFSGLTPYVGVGIGGTYLSVEDYTQSFAVPPQSPRHKDHESWRFTYAFHAGLSYELTHALTFDLGYTYARMEDGGFAGYSIDTNISQPQIYDEGIDNHVIRAGLRYHW
ncbi:MAG: porin family protein [Ahrensia sp.]|nr:porin family protein [Ahrensia sp.]